MSFSTSCSLSETPAASLSRLAGSEAYPRIPPGAPLFNHGLYHLRCAGCSYPLQPGPGPGPSGVLSHIDQFHSPKIYHSCGICLHYTIYYIYRAVCPEKERIQESYWALSGLDHSGYRLVLRPRLPLPFGAVCGVSSPVRRRSALLEKGNSLSRQQLGGAWEDVCSLRTNRSTTNTTLRWVRLSCRLLIENSFSSLHKSSGVSAVSFSKFRRRRSLHWLCLSSVPPPHGDRFTLVSRRLGGSSSLCLQFETEYIGVCWSS